MPNETLTREEEATLLDRIQRGGKRGEKATARLCELLAPYIMHLSRNIALRYPSLDIEDVSQCLWVRVLWFAKAHDPDRSRLMHMVRMYAAPKVLRELTYQKQRQPAKKSDITTWRHDTKHVDDVCLSYDPRAGIDDLIDVVGNLQS